MSFYRYNGAKLPEVLDSEYQDKLLEEFYKTRDEGVREELIKHNLRLVVHEVKKFIGVYRDLDDLMSIGIQELIHVIDNKYDISKGIKLSTYASDRIYRKLYYEVNKAKRLGDAIYRTSIHAKPYNPDFLDGEELDIKDEKAFNEYKNIPDEEDFRDSVEMICIADEFLKTLADKRDRYVFIRTFGLHGECAMTPRELSEELCLSHTMISNIQNRLKTNFRKFYLNIDRVETKGEELDSVRQYIEETDNETYKFILEHYFGLNGKKRMTGPAICRELGISNEEHVASFIRRLRDCGKISEQAPKAPLKDVEAYLEGNNDKKEVELLEYCFGLNGKPKIPVYKLAEKYNISIYLINTKIEYILKRIEIMNANNFTREDLITLRDFSFGLTTHLAREIFDHTYMVNGKKYMTTAELAKKLKIDEDRVLIILDRINVELKDFMEAKEKQPN